MDREAWWTTVHEVARIRRNLVTKQLQPPPPGQYLDISASTSTQTPTCGALGNIFAPGLRSSPLSREDWGPS